MASALYPGYKDLLGEEGIHMTSDTIKAIMVDADTYTYSGTHTTMDDVTGTGGTAQTLSGKTWVNGRFDANDITFTSVAGTVSYEALILFLELGGDPDDNPLIAYLDDFSAVTSNGGDITFQFHTDGIFQL